MRISEWGMKLIAECGMRNVECGMRNRPNADCGIFQMRSADCGMRNRSNADCGM